MITGTYRNIAASSPQYRNEDDMEWDASFHADRNPIFSLKTLAKQPSPNLIGELIPFTIRYGIGTESS